jgi:hypothetical protein
VDVVGGDGIQSGRGRLPTFLVIGAMKSGTTTVYRHLLRHPQVFVPKLKELDFFVGGPQWHAGVDWYRSQYEDSGDAVALGDVSPNYTKYPTIPHVPERIAELMPDVRLIYLLAHPLARMQSHYLHFASTGFETRPCERALLEDERYLNVSRYGMQVARYLSCFDRSQLLLLRSEDLRNDGAATMRRIHEFVGVQPDGAPNHVDIVAHRTADKRVPRAGVRRLSSAGAYRRGVELLPRRAARLWEQVTTAPAGPERAELSPSARAKLLPPLRDDLALLQSLTGEDFSSLLPEPG